MAVLKKGYSTTSSKSKNGWYYLDAKKGWCNGKYLKKKTTTKTIVTKKKKKKVAPKVVKKAKKKKPAPPKYITTAQRKLEAVKANIALKKIKPTTARNYEEFVPVKIKTAASHDTGMIPVHQPIIEKKAAPAKMSISAADQGAGVGIESSNASSDDDGEKIFSYLTSDVDGTLAVTDDTDMGWSMNAIHKNLSIMNNSDYEHLFTRMNRFKSPIPDYALTKTLPYVFFTRPGLNLYTGKDELRPVYSDTFFEYMHANYYNATRSLTNRMTEAHKFNPFLSNTAESFELSDEVIGTVEHGETYTGMKNVYARNTNASNTASQFNIAYTDDKRLTIYNMHKLWIEYMSQIQRGFLIPSSDYIHKKIIDYACAVYYIVCANDGETILYWVKYTGVFPLNTPSSALSWTKGSSPSIPRFNINYSYAIREEMNPLILTEFNLISRKIDASSYRAPFDSDLSMITNGMVGMPFIEGLPVPAKLGETSTGIKHSSGSVGTTFKLRFRGPEVPE